MRLVVRRWDAGTPVESVDGGKLKALLQRQNTCIKGQAFWGHSMTFVRLLSLSIIASLTVAASASAKTFTAVCSNIQGTRVDLEQSGFTWDKDRLRDTAWTFTWQSDQDEVFMVMQNSASAGGKQFSQRGFKIQDLDSHVTIISPLPGAVWVYTIYTVGGLVVSQHTTDNTNLLPSAKLMTGSCRMT
jgi:hypothetical protein